MREILISTVRTTVPALWTMLLTWLVSRGVPGGITELLSGVGAALVPVALAVVYGILRWLETKFPWLSVLLMGSSQQPSYGSKDPA